MSKSGLPSAAFWLSYWRFLKPFHRMLLRVFLWTVAMQGLALIEPAIIMGIVDAIVKDPTTARQHIWLLSGLSFGALCGIGVVKYLKDIRICHLNAAIYHDVQQGCAEKLLRLSMSFHLRTNSGELMGKIVRGTGKIMDTTFFLMFEILPLIIQTVLTMIMLLFLRPYAALILVPTVLVFAGLTHHLKVRTRESRRQRHHHDDEADRRIGEAVWNVMTVQSFNCEEHEAGISRHHRGEFRRLFMSEVTLQGKTDVIRNSIVSLGRVAMLALCAFAVFRSEISIGMLILIVTLAERTFVNCYRFGGIYDRVMDAQEPVQKILDLMAEPENDPDPVDPEVLEPRSSRSIDLCNVSYAYPKDGDTQPMHLALREVGLSIQPGEMIGIVGQSGSGKSTLAKLMMGFVRPTIGSVCLDGVDVRHLKRADVRNSIGFVSQEVELFDDSIRANICYGKMDATDEEIVTAAKAAHAHDFIMEAGGYGTLLGNRGLKLSGGQRQRIGIARALLVRPSILVFDEATSSVDPETIWAIKQAIDSLRGGCTMIVISHQLSTVQNANRIVVMTKGRIEAVGKHHDLLRTNPTYQRLVRTQQQLDEGIQVQVTRPMLS